MIPELSIIVPVYNEEQRLALNLLRIIGFCEKNIKRWELIIVNDGSTDNTQEKLNQLEKNYQIPNIRVFSYMPNQGKGFAIKFGVPLARYKKILFTDIDLSTPLFELFKLYKYIKCYHIVIASRNMSDSKVKRENKWRALAGKIYPYLVQKILQLDIKDTQCGFKLFLRTTARALFKQQQVDGWAFDAEILYLAKQNNLWIKEVGVEWNNDKRSKLKLISSSIKMLKDLYYIRKIHEPNHTKNN